jgi:hypothetical protein
MNIPENVLKALARRPAEEIAAWLSQGYLNWAMEKTDPFAPHSYFSAFAESPAEQIEALYNATNETVRGALHHGVEKIGKLCRAESRESGELSAKRRKDLAEEFNRLCRELICFRAAGSLAQIGGEDFSFWRNAFGEHTEMFRLCLGSLEHLAIRFDHSVFSAGNSHCREPIASALRTMAYHPQFKPELAPKLLYALISVTPESLFDHLKFIGRFVVVFHQDTPGQEMQAYRTAQRIVDRALDQLIKDFPRLDIERRDSRDGWLIDALFEKQHGALVLRAANDDTSVTVVRRDQRNAEITLTNPGIRTNSKIGTLIRESRERPPFGAYREGQAEPAKVYDIKTQKYLKQD